jgi:predicted transcriptional regulator
MENIKKYKYRKVNPKILSKMKRLREKGLTYKKIASNVNISESCVQYWLNPQQKDKTAKRSKKVYKKLTQKQKKEKNKKRQPYTSQYLKERYNNDEEFRKRFIKTVGDSHKRMRKKWISEGNCSRCGGKREDKRWKTCERCRETLRKYSRKGGA